MSTVARYKHVSGSIQWVVSIFYLPLSHSSLTTENILLLPFLLVQYIIYLKKSKENLAVLCNQLLKNLLRISHGCILKALKEPRNYHRWGFLLVALSQSMGLSIGVSLKSLMIESFISRVSHIDNSYCCCLDIEILFLIYLRKNN